MSSWRALHAFSQPLTAEPGEIVFVTPMRFASVLRLGEGGAREVVAMRWGFSRSEERRVGKECRL